MNTELDVVIEWLKNKGVEYDQEFIPGAPGNQSTVITIYMAGLAIQIQDVYYVDGLDFSIPNADYDRNHLTGSGVINEIEHTSARFDGEYLKGFIASLRNFCTMGNCDARCSLYDREKNTVESGIRLLGI